MARDYKWTSKGQEMGIDGAIGITGAVTLDSTCTITGATTQTGALGVTGALTYNTGLVCTPATIAADGTLAGKGLYIFNGGNGAIHLPLVTTYNGYTVRVTNNNGTGTATLTADAADSAAIVAGADSAGTFLITPYTSITLTAYSAGTIWAGQS